MRPTDLIVNNVDNQHRNAIMALAAIVASLPNVNQIDPEVVKQKVRQSNLFGQQLPPAVYAAAERIALNILSKT